jgi:circadian clock protein KaiC
MLTRVIDFIKNEKITAVFTSLGDFHDLDRIEQGVSSLMDTWLGLRVIEVDDRRKREFYVLKSRGMAHSHDVREMIISDGGIGIRSAYAGAQAPGERLTRAASTPRNRSTARGRRAAATPKRNRT